MAKQKTVFISYSSKDKILVQKMAKMLKEMGIRCWKAPEMIPAGSSYARIIPKAIRECEIFLLVVSETAQESIWVEKETDCAISHRKTIIPIQIDDVPLNETFRFYLNNIQMISCANNMDAAMEELKNMLRLLIQQPEVKPVDDLETAEEQGEKSIEAAGTQENKDESKMHRNQQGRMSFARTPGKVGAFQLNRIPVECRKCGSKKLTNISRGTFRCEDCGEKNFDDYQTVRNYLEEVGMAPAVVIEKDTGVPMRVITHFFREEYLEIPKGSSVRVPCERCGTPIRTGVLCDACKKIKGAYASKDTNVGWHS